MTAADFVAVVLFSVASVALAAEPPADLIKELAAKKGWASPAGAAAMATTLFTRLRDHAEEIRDPDRTLFMPLLGDCLSSGMPDETPACTEFDAKDLAVRAPAARQKLRGIMLRWDLAFDHGPTSSEVSLGQYDFARKTFSVEVEGSQ